MRYALAIAAFIALVVGAMYYFGMFSERLQRGTPVVLDGPNDEPVEIAIEEVARGLEVPWSIVWTSPTRMLVTERPGRIRVIENPSTGSGQAILRPEPLHTFEEVVSGSEEGLMSLAVHPEYATNKFVYASLAYSSERGIWVKVVRFRDEGRSISDVTTIVDAIPAAQYHAGSRLKFGPDGKLHITTGDATDRDIAQDLDSLGGKILRVNDDGSIPSDNPFPNSPVWSYGHRNPQGIHWDSAGNMYETEHGPSTFDGPPGGDEVNRIVKGENYGWPLVSHEETREGTVAPLLVFTPAEAPASAVVYSGKLFPQFKGNLFFGALVGEGLMRIVFNAPDSVARYEKLAEVDLGRIREVTEGPDGAIYFSTSNKDGRGSPAQSDDRIFRIVPKE